MRIWPVRIAFGNKTLWKCKKISMLWIPCWNHQFDFAVSIATMEIKQINNRKSHINQSIGFVIGFLSSLNRFSCRFFFVCFLVGKYAAKMMPLFKVAVKNKNVQAIVRIIELGENWKIVAITVAAGAVAVAIAYKPKRANVCVCLSLCLSTTHWRNSMNDIVVVEEEEEKKRELQASHRNPCNSELSSTVYVYCIPRFSCYPFSAISRSWQILYMPAVYCGEHIDIYPPVCAFINGIRCVYPSLHLSHGKSHIY